MKITCKVLIRKGTRSDCRSEKCRQAVFLQSLATGLKKSEELTTAFAMYDMELLQYETKQSDKR